MTILRHYELRAAPGRSEELQAALAALAARVRGCAGCEKVELFTDSREEERYVFVEHWRSSGDRDAAGAALGKQAFAAVGATLAEPPQTRDLIAIGH